MHTYFNYINSKLNNNLSDGFLSPFSTCSVSIDKVQTGLSHLEASPRSGRKTVVYYQILPGTLGLPLVVLVLPARPTRYLVANRLYLEVYGYQLLYLLVGALVSICNVNHGSLTYS